MAPKLTIPDESEMSGANLLPPMAPNPHKKQHQPGPRLNQNLVGESISNSISNMMNQTSHTVLHHDKTRISGVSVGKPKAMKQQSSKASTIQVQGNSSIRTLIRLANRRSDGEDEEGGSTI